MKKVHLIALLLAAGAMAIVVSTFEGASRYVSFEEAHKMSESSTKPALVHVIGSLPKQTGHAQSIQEAPDRRSFSFLLTDEAGQTQLVRHAQPMPTDFRRAEQVVIIGYATSTHFQAQKILLKCPSKYEATGYEATTTQTKP